MSGAMSVTFENEGKEMTRESVLTLVFTDIEELHGNRVMSVTEDVAIHAPAVDGVVALKQLHAVQPAVVAAGTEQQQPPAQTPEEQSKETEQVSPGFIVKQEPVFAAHDKQPRAAEELEQQKPPMQAAEAQVEFEVHKEPGEEREVTVVRVVPEEPVQVESAAAPAYMVPVLAGHARGAEEPGGQ